MVGCVIVHEGRIIGEGYHRAYGKPHAEVNAIDSVRDPSLLAASTLYVNLEPCSHFGKTPPCSDLIVAKQIAKVVIGTPDPNLEVSGGGMRMLREAGVKVTSGILEEECLELNKRFFTYINRKRPWILLKWARSRDGFIDRDGNKNDPEGIGWITGMEARQLVHKWRSEEGSILVGTNTALKDNPELTVRYWKGPDPLRLVIDREGKLPADLHLFDGTTLTHVFTSNPGKDTDRVKYIHLPGGNDHGDDYIPHILDHLYRMEVISLMVEGGASLLNSFLESGVWDEARVFTGNCTFRSGVPSPMIGTEPSQRQYIGDDLLEVYRNG
jgi:diaminohydroxyphosphoribosylaminopyrimidine deaminase/5-amino-6-(5-phosphoribosylamino)uracil reductase